MSDTISLALTMASAFVGAIVAVFTAGYKLNARFASIYAHINKLSKSITDAMHAHEMADQKQFSEVKADVAGVRAQIQAIVTFAPRQAPPPN